jgi:hypothetical protein
VTEGKTATKKKKRERNKDTEMKCWEDYCNVMKFVSEKVKILIKDAY